MIKYSCDDWMVLENSEILLVDKIKTKTYSSIVYQKKYGESNEN